MIHFYTKMCYTQVNFFLAVLEFMQKKISGIALCMKFAYTQVSRVFLSVVFLLSCCLVNMQQAISQLLVRTNEVKN